MEVARRALALFACILILGIASTANAKQSEEPSEKGPAQAEASEEDSDDTVSEREAEAKDEKWVLMGGRFGPSWDGRENYSDRGVNEFTIVGGNYLGENWKNTYYVGGQYIYHLNDTLAFGAQYNYSPIVVDKDTPFYASLRTDAVHIATSLCQLNTPAAWRIGKKIYNMDFYFTLGVGAMQINQQWEPTGLIGGGTRIYFPVPWIAFRLDVNSYIHMTPLGGRSDLSGDVSMGGGISFLFPNRKREGR